MHEILYDNINTFVSQWFIFEEKNKPFLLEKASNLTHEFLYGILTRKINKIFLLKMLYKNSCVKFDTFSKRNGSFFPQKRGAEKRKC